MNLISTKKLSEMLNISISTLRDWRLKKYGPGYIKLNGLIRYRLEDVCDWVQKQKNK